MYPILSLHFNDPLRKYKQLPHALPEGLVKPQLTASGYHSRGTCILHESLQGMGLSFGRIQVSCTGIVRGTWRLSTPCVMVAFSEFGQVQLAIRNYGDAIAPMAEWQSSAPVPSGSHFFFANSGVHRLFYFACSYGMLQVLADEMPSLVRLRDEPANFTPHPWQEYQVGDEDFAILRAILESEKQHLQRHHFMQQQFHRLMRRYADRIERYGDNPGMQTETVMSKAVEFIREHYTNPELNIAMIADAVSLSVDGLAKVFQRNDFRATPLINALRVYYGETLLRTTDTLVGDVAFLSGFRDRSRFSILFKEKFGVNPSGFRNSLKNRKKI